MIFITSSFNLVFVNKNDFVRDSAFYNAVHAAVFNTPLIKEHSHTRYIKSLLE